MPVPGELDRSILTAFSSVESMGHSREGYGVYKVIQEWISAVSRDMVFEGIALERCKRWWDGRGECGQRPVGSPGAQIGHGAGIGGAGMEGGLAGQPKTDQGLIAVGAGNAGDDERGREWHAHTLCAGGGGYSLILGRGLANSIDYRFILQYNNHWC